MLFFTSIFTFNLFVSKQLCYLCSIPQGLKTRKETLKKEGRVLTHPANIHCWANVGQMQSSALARCRNQRWPNVDLHQCAVLAQRWQTASGQQRLLHWPSVGRLMLLHWPSVGRLMLLHCPAWANCIGCTAVIALVHRWQINATALAQRGQINATALVKYWQTALQELTESLSAHYK